MITFDSEEELLMEWRDLVAGFDPDIVIGYDTLPFHLPFLLLRSERLGLEEFGELGRLRGDCVSFATAGSITKRSDFGKVKSRNTWGGSAKKEDMECGNTRRLYLVVSTSMYSIG